MKPTIAILGSGHSGHALAASFAAKGFKVTLVSMRRAQQGEIKTHLLSKIQVKYQDQINSYPIRFSSQVSEAMRADIVFCSMPATYHEDVVKRILPFVRDNQYLYFSSYFGASRMLAALARRPALQNVTVVESMSAIHASRSKTYGSVEILAMKDAVPVSTFPSYRTSDFIESVIDALPCLVPAPTILATSLNNVGPILHVPLMIFSTARIEITEDKPWNLYKQGLSGAVIRYIKELDKERQAIANKINVQVFPLEEIMLNIFYEKKSQGARDFWHWIRHNDIHASATIGAPNAINTRYLTEGVYYGLVPLSHISNAFGVSTPLINATIEMTDHLLGENKPQRSEYDFLSPEVICNIKSIARAA